MSSHRSVTRSHFSILGWFFTLGSLSIIVDASPGRDFVFPDEEILHSTPSYNNRRTVVKCPAQMIWTKDDGDTEGYCACVPGNLYSRELDRCFVQYTQGPCKKGEYFVKRANDLFAQCVSNPCPESNTIRYNGKCHDLYVTGGPCGPNQVLTIPDNSTEPKCVDVIFASRSILDAPCGPGFRLDKNGICREIMF